MLTLTGWSARCAVLGLLVLVAGAVSAQDNATNPTEITHSHASRATRTLGNSLTLMWPQSTPEHPRTFSLNQGIGPVADYWITVTPTTLGPIPYTLTTTKAAGTTQKTMTVTAPTTTSPKPLTIENHWRGNSGGRGGGDFPPTRAWPESRRGMATCRTSSPISACSPLTGKRMLSQAYGTFVDSADSGPTSAGTSMYVNGKHFTTGIEAINYRVSTAPHSATAHCSAPAWMC